MKTNVKVRFNNADEESQKEAKRLSYEVAKYMHNLFVNYEEDKKLISGEGIKLD